MNCKVYSMCSYLRILEWIHIRYKVWKSPLNISERENVWWKELHVYSIVVFENSGYHIWWMCKPGQFVYLHWCLGCLIVFDFWRAAAVEEAEDMESFMNFPVPPLMVISEMSCLIICLCCALSSSLMAICACRVLTWLCSESIIWVYLSPPIRSSRIRV